MPLLPDTAHRRLNLLSGEYVLVSPHRTQRPWQGGEETSPHPERSRHDPQCYLCPGNPRAGGATNPDYERTFVFDNDFPALQADGMAHSPDEGSLLVATEEYGRCRVVCYSPRHDLDLADLPQANIEGVIETWTEEYQNLGGDPNINHVQIFENRGEIMGCSNPHPHGQIWAQASIPNEVSKELERQLAHYQRNGSPLLQDYLKIELTEAERVVFSNTEFAALVPWWATWPFETLVLPRRPVSSLTQLDAAQRASLAGCLKRLTGAYDDLFGVPFPYSAGIHQSPTDGGEYPHVTLHMHFYPPLLRSATVRKFMVGYEMLGEPQRDLTPEASAELLRSQGQ